MTQPGYYQQPTISQDQIVFVCDDSLWAVSARGGSARKLTSTHADCSSPKLSPDGNSVAFITHDEGHPEAYIMSLDGGSPRRLTYLGSQSCFVLGWTPDGKKIIVAADGPAPFFRHTELFEVSPDGQELTPLNLGHATGYSRDSKGRVVIGRNSQDPAFWKRYHGGRAGEIWVDAEGKGQFRPLARLNGNMVLPMWVKGRVYFLSDHEGIGNIYSCKPDGRDLKRHTHQSEYYVRFPSTDGERIIYSAAGDLYLLDCRSDEVVKLNIQAAAHQPQSERKFVEVNSYLEHYSINPQGSALGIISRGQAFTMPLFEGPCIHYGKTGEIRYRLLEWLTDGENFVCADDAEGYERVAIHCSNDVSKKAEYLTHEDIGRVVCLRPSPHGKLLAISNHRCELMLVDVDKKKTFLIDTSPAERIVGLSWSPDSRWLAYTYYSHENMSIIKVVDCTTYKAHELTRPVRIDCEPCFDPEGRYLYFISNREFKPVYDTQQFELSFPQSTRVFAIPLSKDTPSPFAADSRPFIKREQTNPAPAPTTAGTEAKAASKKSSSSKKQENRGGWVHIDLEGIQDRVLAFPFMEGLYTNLCAARGRVLFLSFAVKGIGRDFNWFAEETDPANLISFDFSEQKCSVLQSGLFSMRLANDHQTLIYKTRENLRVIDALQPSSKGPDSKFDSYGRATGYIDLGRCNLLVEPGKEWPQMYREAWRLQKEQFWDEKMSAVDWDLVYDRYARLLPKLRTRSELSDILWEMQGELGTSHAYEYGGDRLSPRPYYMGFLGCDLEYDSKSAAYRITRILRGDSWDREADSPLAEPGLNIEEGDLIVAVNGRPVSKETNVQEFLLKSGGMHVQLTLKHGSKTRSVTVKTLTSERYLRYRHWVESNRLLVSKATKDKVGYIHIPDMGPFGFAEFHRSYLAEYHHEGLIVDARYNRGGHVSALLLEKLMRKRIGYDVQRWGQPQPYPMESPSGPMVAITNQFAGSDGDIFSHCFKLYELGPLVGKRTWGGVIGINPRHRLVDGTLTTQPEYSFWFQDVGWSVENYGTDPDYEIDFRPQDYRAGRDPQLERAISLVMDALKKNPVRLPSFKSRPRLPLPAPLKKR